MSDTREFPTAVIASLSSGVSLCSFDKIHEAAEYLMGYPIWAHHFASKDLWTKMQRAVETQCPGMPTDLPGVTPSNYLDMVASLENQFGKSVTIMKGSGGTALTPTDGIPDHLRDKTIIISAGK